MSDGTHIEWTDATWNVVNGCSVLSPGCTNCYAMRLAGTRMRHHPSRQGLTVPSTAGPVWNGTVRFNDKVMLDPLHWRKPRKIFVCAHGDLFHEKVPDEWIDKVFAVMALAAQHTFQVLTKRPERARAYITASKTQTGIDCALERLNPECWDRNTELGRLPLPNVWLGTSVEDQKRADERIPILLETPAAVRWLSCEPLLGPIDLRRFRNGPDWDEDIKVNALTGETIFPSRDEELHTAKEGPGIDWVVVGGESGPGARPMHPDWARSLRDQCDDADVPFLFKQWGSHRPCTNAELKQACGAVLVGDRATGAYMMRTDKSVAGRLLDAVQHDGYPA